MTTREILEERDCAWLLESSFFAALPTAEQDAVLAEMQWEDYTAGQVIIEEGQRPRGIELIVEGRVSVAVRNQGGFFRTITEIGPGNLIGERAVIRRTTTVARVTALSPMLTLYVPASRFTRLLADNPTLLDYGDNLVQVRDRSDELLRVMKMNPLLRSLGREALDRLLQTSYLTKGPPRGSAHNTLQLPEDCAHIVVRGTVKLHAIEDDGTTSKHPLAVQVQGSLLNHVPIILERPSTTRLLLTPESEVLRIPEAAFRAITRQNPRVLRRLKEEMASLGWSRGGQHDISSNIIALSPTERRMGATTLAYGIAAAVRLEGRPAPVLIDLTGEETAQRLGFAVEESNVGELSVRQMKVPAVWGIRVMWPAQRGAAIDLAQALSSEAENVIVATSAQVRHHAHAIAKADAVVQFHRGGQLSHDVPDRNGQFHVNARLLGDTVEQPVSDSRRNQVRVPQDKATADVFWRDGELSALISNSNPLGRACQRLGRVLLGQSVGLALGGGGAWGFAHVALLRGLENAGIAVDYVAGSSFGSLVAGLYAAGGMEALDALMRHRARIQTVLLTSTVSTRPITRFVNDLIGEVRLEDTEIPFFPVTADLFTSQEVILERGTVSDGVRASSSLPPVFPSMPSGTTRLVDGGIINIVPASVVWDAGADFVLASNVIPRTTLTLTSETRLSRRMPDWTKPLERLSDFMQSAYLLMWRSGVDRGREADYTIDLGLSEHRMHEFAQGDAIVDKALGHVDAHMTHIVRAYQSACALYTAEA